MKSRGPPGFDIWLEALLDFVLCILGGTLSVTEEEEKDRVCVPHHHQLHQEGYPSFTEEKKEEDRVGGNSSCRI